jgi:endonuclease/exonuclease/phosphatase (EEP) superfamily protein YafD
MRVLRVAFEAVVLALACVCALAAALAHLGRVSLQLDVLAHFAPLWLVVCSITGFMGLVVASRWRRATVIVSTLGLLAAAALMAPEFLRDAGPHAKAGTPGQIKLIQLNVWSDGQMTDTNLAWLMRQDADIIVLQETYGELRQALLRQPGWHVTCAACETVILSRQAPVSVGPIAESWTPAPLTRAVFRDARGEYAVIGVHHSWPTEIAVQQSQEGQLAETLMLSPRDRTIVTGDFNSASWAFSRRRWDATFGLTRRERGMSSWPARPNKYLRWLRTLPFLPIDHVYAGKDWATVSVKRGPRVGSDHYPVMVTLAPTAPR